MAAARADGAATPGGRVRPEREGAARVDWPTALCLGTVGLVVAMVWALPRPVDDLFVALAGGRDVLAGRLGQPDEWAFTTEGRVWLNQNWATHVLFHLAHRAAGEFGLLAGKAMLLIVSVAGLVLACRARAVTLPTALLGAGAALAASRSYLDLRPNLMSLVMTAMLLWVLAGTRTRPRQAWVAVLVIWAWSNLHGSFLLGLALMAIWILSVALASRTARRSADVRPRVLLLAGVTAAALLLAAFGNPFGASNLTHALLLTSDPVWRRVDEWRPIFAGGGTAFGSTWEFVIWAALWTGAIVGRAHAARRGTPGGPSPDLGFLVFDVVAGALVLALAFQARRFVPLAIFVMTPAVAASVDAWVAGRYRRGIIVAMAIALAVPPALLAPPLWARYRPENPLYERESVLARMVVVTPFFPAELTQFVVANRLEGRVVNAWEWEGFLRWHGAKLRLFAGSRAQQVYRAATYVEFQELLRGGPRAASVLAAKGVHLAVLPMTAQYGHLLQALVYADEAQWAYLYADGRHAALVDTAWPGNAALLAAAERGALAFPDRGIQKLSRALYLASPASYAGAVAIDAALRAAIAEKPSGLAYATLGEIVLADDASARAALPYFEGERKRLRELARGTPADLTMLDARRWATLILANLYRALGRQRAAATMHREAQLVDAEVEHLKLRWGWGDTPGFS